MNIFWLDVNLDECVKYHCDKHVVKMIVEYTQLLSSASRLSGVEQGYKLSHSKHPDTLWLLESLDNWRLLKLLTEKLCDEYTYRYGKKHKSCGIAKSLITPNIENKGVTEPPQCMPDRYKCDNFITAYRNYYIGEKVSFVSWRKREVPWWFNFDERLLLDMSGTLEEFNPNKLILKDKLINYCEDMIYRISQCSNVYGFPNEEDRKKFLNEFNKLADIIFRSKEVISVYNMNEILKLTKVIKSKLY